MREIKFRQPIFKNGKFSRFHYWGFVKEGQFVSVAGDLEEAHKTSQEYTNLTDKNEKEIYEGDIVKGVHINYDDYVGNYEIVFLLRAFVY